MPKEEAPEFQWFVWTVFAIENWVLDFGRPIAMLAFPLEWFPLNRPSVGDYFHMAYNVITPFCIYKLMKSTGSRRSNELLINLCLIFFIMGASIHLVGDSINHRLSLIGYQLHLTVEDNPIMKQLEPKSLLSSFELLYFYDEVLGHYMWYIPYFICLTLYFNGCFVASDLKRAFSPNENLLKNNLIFISASYYWYLVTEGQITPLFLASLAIMHSILVVKRFLFKKHLDQNGAFLLFTFQLTFLLVAAWSYYFWDDEYLRIKYPGLVYVPEPWSVYSLHFQDKFKLF